MMSNRATSLATLALTTCERSFMRKNTHLAPPLYAFAWSRFFSTATSDVPMDYFQLLGVERSYDTSQEELKKIYREQMKELHPDKHTLKPMEEREKVAEMTSQVTSGYEMLSDDYQRALHLLDLEGHAIEDDISGNIMGTEFLMQIMELREEVDDAQSDEELNKLRQENMERMSGTVHDLTDAFHTRDFDRARRLTATLQYWNRIQETILDKITSLE